MIHTEALGEIAKRTARIEDSMEVIKLQSEIERLDREWMYIHGRERVPSKADSVPRGGAVVLVGLFLAALPFVLPLLQPHRFTFIEVSDVSPAPLIPGVFLVVCGIGCGFYWASQAERHAEHYALISPHGSN